MNTKHDIRSTLALLIALLALAMSVSAIIVSGRAHARADLAYESNPFIEGSPARERAQRSADRIRSQTNLRGLSMGVVMFARANDGQPPSPQTWAQDLVGGGFIASETLSAHGAEPVEHPYHYIRPSPEQIESLMTDQDTPIVFYEDPDLWRGEGGNVGYLDTSTEWFEGRAYRELVERLRAQD